MSDDTSDLHLFGACVHAALLTLHALGVLYNARRRNPYQAGIHAMIAVYDLWAINQHRKETL